ncbi:LysR family transcriptional regulator [uncultured Piscinibacter sp.]|uniref:LysR family transcriptional regulator n=1 Tax=uncultured Piscinibacter sp. TaxID=1131835 RepID=UPI002635EA45|nr:LysR family transcriptional regulator [uncultured Piscinibacter sp.]
MDRHLALQCFCRVVETGGFAAAARDLDCSPSMVSKTIQHLEEWTGSRLLARTTRRMQLTEAGERFYAYCRRVLDDTERTLGAIRAAHGELSGRLVLAVPVSLTLSFLKDHLHAFQAAHPDIELELRLSDRPVDMVRDGIDVALRGQAQLGDSSLIAVPLMAMQRVVAAAPDYWRRHGKPDHPSGLAAHNCLPYLLGSDATRWQFDGPGGVQVVEVHGSFRADNSLMLIDAMLRGVGVGLVPRVMMRTEIAEGRLETALDDWRAEARQVFAIYPSREHLPQRVRTLVRFLKERLAASGG